MRGAPVLVKRAVALLVLAAVANGVFAAGPRERDLRERAKRWVVSILCRLGTPGGCA